MFISLSILYTFQRRHLPNCAPQDTSALGNVTGVMAGKGENGILGGKKILG